MAKPLPTQALAELFGSKTALANAAGVTRSLLDKWDVRETGLRKRGHVPSRYNPLILLAARAAGLEHAVVAKHLDMHACPLCGNRLAPGAQIDARLLRRLGNGTR